MNVDDFTVLMKSLSDSNRIRALIALKKGELCVCQIMELLELATSTVSKHMSILKQAKLVESRKSGRWVYYKLAENNAEIQKELAQFTIASLNDAERIKRDEVRLKKILDIEMEELCRNQRGEKCCPKDISKELTYER